MKEDYPTEAAEGVLTVHVEVLLDIHNLHVHSAHLYLSYAYTRGIIENATKTAKKRVMTKTNIESTDTQEQADAAKQHHVKQYLTEVQNDAEDTSSQDVSCKNNSGSITFSNDRTLTQSYLITLGESEQEIESLANTIYRNMQVRFDTQSTLKDFTSSLSETILPFIDTSTSLSSAINETLQSISKVFEKLYKAYEWPKFLSVFKNFDQQALQNGAIQWGNFGWTLSGLSLKEIANVPQTEEEANTYYARYTTNEQMDEFFENILNSIPRKRDFKECVVLYRNHHYKPCAMMLCALIEGYLIMQLPKKIQKRNGQVALDKISVPESEIISWLNVQNISKVYNHFFAIGKNFDRSIEGELNRNFLMHGMMYKPVAKRTCIKLFLLLGAIVDYIG